MKNREYSQMKDRYNLFEKAGAIAFGGKCRTLRMQIAASTHHAVRTIKLSFCTFIGSSGWPIPAPTRARETTLRFAEEFLHVLSYSFSHRLRVLAAAALLVD